MREVSGPRTARPLAWALALLVAACGEANSLEGSLGEVVDLRFDGVEVSVTDAAVSVGYFRRKGEARDLVFKLVLDSPPGSVVHGVRTDLSPMPDGRPRAAVTRSVAGDPIRTFAPIKHGFVRFDGPLEIDRPVSGELRVTLGEGGDAGEGRTAFGTFSVERIERGG
ncbi:MAG: hypothetical protein ACOX6T_06945 [Myxococcales bacterium]|jgi:hypothetical protein